MVSAFVNDYMARAVSLAGVRDYLQKPCNTVLLADRIREAARRSGPFPMANADILIRDALARYGIPPHLNGREYLQEAIRRASADRSILRGVTKVMYPELAKHFKTTACCVEQSIRTALVHGWNAETPEYRREFFGPLFDSFTGAPSNVRFIALVVAFLEKNTYQRGWG